MKLAGAVKPSSVVGIKKDDDGYFQKPDDGRDRDREICAAIGPLLREKGQVFVGIDVIGDYLTEINVTSPTGIQELERFDGINVAQTIWEAIEAKRS